MPHRILPKQLKDNFGRVGTLSVFLLLTFTLANSQTTSPTDGSTPLGLSPGSPSGSHALSGFESVNPYNGNLNVHLPLISIGGRGGAGTGSVLTIDSKGWTVRHQETTDLQGNPVDVYTPVANPWGPKAGYGPGVLVARQSGMNPSLSCGITTKIYQQTLTRLTFTTSDGTEFEFRDQALSGAPATVSNPCASTGVSRGTVFTTADGTAATFISDAVVYDKLNSTGSSLMFLSGYLMLRDGSRYRIEGGGVAWLRDRNGNKLSFATNGSVTTITDSLNRTVTITRADFVNTFSDQITVKGFGGATRTLLVTYTQLANALRTTNPRSEPAARYQIQTYHGLFPELNNASSYSSWNPWVVASVTLPNNQQYQFFYNCFAEVARINLPTSGAIEYDHTAGSGAVTDYIDFHIYRRVKERRVYFDGANLESYTTYSESGSPVSVDRCSASGTLLGREKHYYNGDPLSSLFNATGISYPNRLEGREYQSEAYAADGTTLLRRSQTTWVNRAPVSWWWNPGDASEPPNDPRVTDTTSTLADVTPNLVSKQTFGYDDSVPYNNRNNVKEYDFGNGAAGALVRETRTTYITDATYTGTSVHLRSLPALVSVYDAAGVERARSTYEYDNYTTDANHAALISRANISGFDSTFTSSYTTRGNATGTTSYLLTNGSVTSSVSGYPQYDIAGNVVKTIDALGHATTFDFTDRFGAPDGEARANAGSSELNSAGQNSYAQATSVSNALGQTSYVQFDYYLGRPVDAEDANGTIYTGYCNDVLDRPTQIVSASNYPSLKSQSTFSYNDTSRTVTVTRDQNAYGDNLLKGKTFYDGLGRTTEARTYENGTDYIAVQQVPFALQQDPDTSAWVATTQSSNPYRPYLSEQPVWTTTFTDALGRAAKVRTPDSAIARTSYSGNTVTVSDQTGKARKSVSDALGRLTQVNEDPNGVNWATIYAYDVLNNLLTTSQGTQARTFVYDSLKRLSSTTNPENGTVNFTYDNGSNLLVQTDARGVSTHLSYDVLNRGTRRWYNGSSSTTATTHNSPALPSGVGTSSEANFYYDAQTIPSAPTFARGSSTGRLVAVTYGGSGSSAGDYFGYDVLGRDVLKIQQTGGTNYQTTASYSTSGALTSAVYPSGRTVNYGYDAAGRTSTFSGNLGDGVTRTYSTGIVYSSLGGMTKEQFGTDTAVYNKLFYDVRGQLSEIRESTSYTGPTDTTWNRGAIINHYSDNCWGMCGGSNSTTSMTDNNGNLKKQEVYVPLNDQLQNAPNTTWWQRYDYDTLNRLQRVAEITGNAQTDSQQEYVYDRWGNRTIHQTNTWGTGIPKPNFTADANTNRLSAPSGYTMSYDSAGNLTNDTYSGQGQRNYDAENRMTQAWANSQWQTYTYDGSGQRVRRNVNGVETWAIYGIGGQLLAEYAAANPGVSSPQKEYGYRNGQLLITTDAASQASTQNVSWTNAVGVSVSSNNLTKTVGDLWGNAGASSTQTISSGDGYVEFMGSETSTYRMCGLSQGDLDQNYTEIDFTLYATGTGSGSHLYVYESGVYRGDFGAYATGDLLRVAVEGGVVKYKKNGTVIYTSTVAPTYPLSVDTSLYTNGSTLTNVVVSGNLSNTQSVSWTNAVGVSAAGNNLTKTAAAGWGNAGAASTQTITSGDGYVEATASETSTARLVGLSHADADQNYTSVDFGIDMDTGGVIYVFESGNNRGTFGTYATADKLRVAVEGGVVKYKKNGTVFYSSTVAPTYPLLVDTSLYTNGGTLTNVVISSAGGSSSTQIQWLVTDQLGTPRMVFDKTGALANVKRHDYLPFGEEVFNGSRTTAMGYGAADGVRQKFTSQERDNETGLDYMHARYFASAQGRFSSADSVAGSIGNPQSLNRYAYVGNNPLNFSDPTGHDRFSASSNGFAETMGQGGYMSPEDPDNDDPTGLRNRANATIAGWIAQEQAEAGAKAGTNSSGGHEAGHSSEATASASVALADASLGTPQNLAQQQQPDPCANQVLTHFNLRDSSDGNPAIIPYIQSSVAQDFLDALLEINRAVPGGIGFTEVFRTRAQQQELWDNRANNPNPVAHPGTSRHEGGFAFDVPGIATRNAQRQLVQTDLGRTVIPIFARHGFAWGGAFNDPPHFQADPTQHGYRNSAEAATEANDYYLRCIQGR